MSRGRVALVLGLLLVTSGCSGTTPSPDETRSPTATAPAPSTASAPDFDGDGSADVAVGIGETTGRVAIVYASGRRQDLRRSDVDGSASAGFGRAVLARDLNGDGITDLVIGDPGQGAAAAVFLVPGSPTGLDAALAQRLTAPPGLVGFGQALALVPEPTKALAVGAPWDGSGETLGGAVAVYALDTDGRPASDPEVLTQASPGVPGEPAAGDTFGAALAGTGAWLAIGVARKDVAGVRDAGAVVAVDRSATPPHVTRLVQGAAGVPGRAAAEDRFGLALAAGDGHLAVGVPLDDEDGRNAGLVQPFRLEASGPVALDRIRSGTLSTQPAGTLFGFSVAMAHPCPMIPGLVVGAPGTSVRDAGSAGAAWLLPLQAAACPAHMLTEGGTLGGAPIEMASLGVAVGALSGGPTEADTVLLAAAGNAEEGIAGRVLSLAAPFAGPAAPVIDDLRLHEEGVLTLSPSPP